MSNLADNRRARFDYDILETYEAGLVLTGQEVKAAKEGQISLASSFVTFYQGNPYLTNTQISRYKHAGPLPDYDPTHSRRLLLRKKEIHALLGKVAEKGLTIVPLKVYTRGRYIKVEIALARGRQKFDKREAIKKRDATREIRKIRE